MTSSKNADDVLVGRWHGERGATATEYVFLMAFIAIAIATGAAVFGGALGGLYKDQANEVATVGGASS